MGDDQHFGYTRSSNTQLNQLQQMQHHVGEDLMHYPKTDSSSAPAYSPTVNWSDPKYQPRNMREDDKSDKDIQQTRVSKNADTIEKVYQRVMGQKPEQVMALSNQWSQLSMVMQNLADSIYNESAALQNGGKGGKGWQSPAAKAFLSRGPGATIKSLEDWNQAAISNQVGLYYLAGVLYQHQAEMEQLYQQYRAAMVTADSNWGGDHMSAADKAKSKKEKKELYLDMLRTEELKWNTKAQDLEYRMSQGYWQVISDHLNQGSSTVFEGPTDAVMPDPKYMSPFGNIPNVGAPNVNVPNVHAPAVPNVTAPTVPKVTVPPPTLTINPHALPTLTPPDPSTLPAGKVIGKNAPDLSNLPNLHNLPGGMPPEGVPSPGNLGMLPPMLPPGVPHGADGAFPGGRLPNGVLRPNLGAPGGGLNGLGHGPGEAGAPPATPRLNNGALRRPQAPGGPEGGPGRTPQSPNVLRNKGGRPDETRPLGPGEEEEFGRPGSPGQPGTPPVLRGRRSGGRPPTGMENDDARSNPSTPASPTRPGASKPVLNRKRRAGQSEPVAPPPDDTSFTTLPPGAATPILRGTRLTEGSVEEPTPPARALRGAGVGRSVEEPQIASRRKSRDGHTEEKSEADREFERIRQLLSDDQAWTVDTPGGAVLDNTPERQGYQVEPKPTLGSGSGS